MTASSEEMSNLARELWKNGIAGFCATTLSVPPAETLASVSRLGNWIRGQRPAKDLATPLGIHLEGPFISPHACGAHPPSAIRPMDLFELEKLWEASQGTLKLLTVAPEAVRAELFAPLRQFCRSKKIILSLGHSKATEAQATAAFEAGFSGVTHAWNALAFHQRDPGTVGAALGRKGLHVELILDQVHVAPTVMRWTRALHGKEPLCFVSDCVPPAIGTRKASEDPGPWLSFGPLQARFEKGASRLQGGHLAGGGRLLTHAYCDWAETEARATGQPLASLVRQTVRHLGADPLRALGIRPSVLGRKRIEWTIQPGRVHFRTN